MTAYGWAFYAHLMGVAILFIGIGIEWRLVALLRPAKSVEQVQVLSGIGRGLDKLFPITTVLLLVSGGWMVEKVWGWDRAWIDVSLAATILLSATGPLVTGRRLERIGKTAATSPNGPVQTELGLLIKDPVLWAVVQAMAFSCFGLVYLMIAKPGLWESVGVMLVSASVGATLSLFGQVRRTDISETELLDSSRIPSGAPDHQGQMLGHKP